MTPARKQRIEADVQATLAARREYDPTFTLDRQVAEARREIGEARWQQLNAEWRAAERDRP